MKTFNTLRQKLPPQQDRGARPSHPGLLLTRYLDGTVSVPEAGDNGKAGGDLIGASGELRDSVIAAAKRAGATNGPYVSAFHRWQASLEAMDKSISGSAIHECMKVNGRLIVGLGLDSVLETGLALHHTYGVPIIPGSALKGLASHYCDHDWGYSNELSKDEQKTLPATQQLLVEIADKFRTKTGEVHRHLFGDGQGAGHVVFHDAWVLPESLRGGATGILLDVMTPHHRGYNEDGKQPPTDFDDPNPVSFLSVSGKFLIAMSWECPEAFDADASRWLKLTWRLLCDSLSQWGVGGKTNSGYGRLA